MNVQSRSIAEKLREVATAKQLSTQAAVPDEDMSDLDALVDEAMRQIAREAEGGNFETPIFLPEKSDSYISRAALSLKGRLGDVMVITDFGSKKIKVSWHGTNEC